MFAFDLSSYRRRLACRVAIVSGATILAAGSLSAPARAFGLGSIGDVTKTMGAAGNKVSPVDDAHEAMEPPPGGYGRDGEHQAAADLRRTLNPTAAPPVQTEMVAKPADPVTVPAASGHAGGDEPMQKAAGTEPGTSAPPAPVRAAETPPGGAARAPEQAREPAASAQAPAPVAPAAAPPAKSAGVLTAPGPDYYDDRAKETLAAESKQNSRPHPLQLAEPDYDVLVCEAGCRSGGAHVLNRQLKSVKKSAVADTGAPAVVDPAKRPDCRGGCYQIPGGPSRIATATRGTLSLMSEEAGTWMTTVEQAGTEAKTQKVPAAKKAAREDWMSRINREREADGPKAQPKS